MLPVFLESRQFAAQDKRGLCDLTKICEGNRYLGYGVLVNFTCSL